jgi:hypothetical protein
VLHIASLTIHKNILNTNDIDYSITSLGSSTFTSFSQASIPSLPLFFLDLASKKIQPAATTKQHIQIIGLTANQAIPIVTNQTTSVKHKAINLVPTHIIFAIKGTTFARISINSNIIENQANINNNHTNLSIQVIILLDFCAAINISSADTVHCCNNAIDLQFLVVYALNSFQDCFHTILIVHGFTDENVILKSHIVGELGSVQI